MTEITRSWVQYGIAVLSLALATLLRWAIDPWLGNAQPFVTYYFAILFVAWKCSTGTALLVLVLGSILADYLFLPPRWEVSIWGAEHWFGLFLFGLLGTSIIVLYRLQVAARKHAEESRREAAARQEWLQITLTSLSDAVIATDEFGRVELMNPVAETLTGWTQAEAEGRRLDEVFRLVDEKTRQVVKSPIPRALREGTITRCSENSLLVARGGEERPVTDSASPIRDNEGRIIGVVLIFRDRTESRLADEARSRLSFLVESSNDAIISETIDGVVTSWNRGAEQLYGYSEAEVLGRNISMLVPPERPNDVLGLLKQIWRGERIGHYEALRQRKDGSVVTISLGISPIRDAFGHIIGASTIARDISQRKAVEEQLSRAKNAAEAANRAKDQFLAMLSHELRTPLTPVLMAATAALQDPETPHRIAATFEMIRQNIELEARLIDDLLDVMRVIRGKMHYQWKTVDFHELARRVFEICRSDWNAKQIQFSEDLGATRHFVRADPARLQQVLWNLVKNAVKFTPEGGAVRIHTRNLDSQIILEVTDTGIGIASKDLDRIFRAFEQAEDPRTRKSGGLGLGLAISKSITEALGGALQASSPGPDQGATFTLTLPAVASPRNGGKNDAPTLDVHRTHRACRLLLVEDDAVTSRIMGRLLRGIGHTVTTAHSVAQALEVASNDLDLVVSDIGLPDGSGLDLMRRLREGYGLRGIALTGFGTDDDITKSRDAGFVAHITKPVDFSRLEETIQQVASRSE